MNLSQLSRRVRERVPGLSEVRAEINKDGNTGYVIATKDKRMRCAYWDRGPFLARKTEEEVACEVAKELRT